jgi:hypothetical protein
MRPNASDVDHRVKDTRFLANDIPVAGGGHYSHNFATCSGDVLGSTRSSSMYAYAPGSKDCYPAIHTDSTPRVEGFGPSAMHQVPVGILPAQWDVDARAKLSSFTNMCLNTGLYSNYHGMGPLHRPLHSSSDSTTFSFSGVAGPPPLPNTPGRDRRLPIPTARSSTLFHPAAIEPSATKSTCDASTLADVATAATDSRRFDKPGLSAVGNGGSHGYVSDKSAYEAAANHSSHHHLPWPCFYDALRFQSPIALGHSGGQSVVLGSGSASHSAHAEDKQEAAASRS